MAQPQSALRALDQSYLMGIGQGPAPARVPRTRGQTAADMLGALSIGTTPIPIVGDITGMAADAAMYAAYPEERTMGNYAMSAAGILPLVPGVSALRAMKNAPDVSPSPLEGTLDMSQAARVWSQTPNQVKEGEKVIQIPLKDIEHGEADAPGGTLSWPDAPRQVLEYANRTTPFPPIEVLTPDSDSPLFMVVDGSRRLEAARLRGDETISAIVPEDFEWEGQRIQTPSPLEGVVNVGYDVDAISRSYPQTGPGSLNFSNPKKPEELALQKARNLAQKDIIFGNYDPYFAVEDRYFANPELYNLQGDTLVDAMPAKQATIDQYAERFDTPQIRDNIRQAYERGLSPTSQNWYAMGQLQDEFIRELGPIDGPKMFKERFADAMAATTGGADPTANLLMAAYVNNRKAQGLSLPTGSTNYPHPIGGRYLAGNMAMADKIIMNETPLTASGQPKRFNFSANFLGDMNRATIDEQMSQLYESGLTSPPGASYGVMERVLGDVGREFGVLPGNVQDVAWAGAKGTQGKPMIQHINEAIERTARVTNKTPREVLVDSIINARSPLYGAAGATIGLSALRNIQRDEEPQPD